MKTFYIVWVGGIGDNYETKEQAEQAAKEWREKGYTDVLVELAQGAKA